MSCVRRRNLDADEQIQNMPGLTGPVSWPALTMWCTLWVDDAPIEEKHL